MIHLIVAHRVHRWPIKVMEEKQGNSKNDELTDSERTFYF